MTKPLTIASALLAAALAAPSPATADELEECNKLAFDLAEKVAAKKLPVDDAMKMEDKLGTLEGQCSGGAFAEAEKTAKEIEAAIAK